MVRIVLAIMIGRITISFGGLQIVCEYHRSVAAVKDTMCWYHTFRTSMKPTLTAYALIRFFVFLGPSLRQLLSSLTIAQTFGL